ncbi:MULTISPECIES: cardiolipin synthase [unclassified Bacillus (in: firmicutes)]|uniref:cardiolipin synthase n=1 Tax=unclassified Bacillus (in: firmicutes) TaxID=185979 RepID=UPI000BF0480E|nr:MULTISPECIES: cardiolipin synthase [unclassified Bacillus (in: firmicutes)]PEJ56466.1 cardiolipin synthase [Bacillus sp. AFS002410]PEL00051.1 cardiolipin synthase [Bacillus sp. AFS017336]
MDINFITILLIVNILLAGVLIFIEKRDVAATWAWLMILLFIPIVGFLLYLFLGRQLKQKNFYHLSNKERSYLQLAVTNQANQIHNDQHFIQDELLSKHSHLIMMNLKSANSLLTTENEIQTFSDGYEKFNSLFEDIQNAEKEINIQYYIIQRDSLGKKLRDELTKKAEKGVKVRVLYDDIGSKKITPSFFKDLVKHGGEVKAFFPSFLRLINFRLNNRNHRKLCIIDGRIAYIGGFNVGDEYLGIDKKFGYWRDTHFRIKGDSVNQIQGRFILDWQQATKQHVHIIEEFTFNNVESIGNTPIQIVASGPNSETEHLKNMYVKLITSAKQSVYIQTPYFIPDASIMDACKIAALSGIDVRIMIPSKPDHPFVHWASLSYAGELLSYGAKILLYENGFLHAKTIVIDQEVASVGTTNIDTRSFKLNFEINAIVYSEKESSNLQDLFISDSKYSSELTLEKYQARTVFIKIKEAISRLLSPIL